MSEATTLVQSPYFSPPKRARLSDSLVLPLPTGVPDAFLNKIRRADSEEFNIVSEPLRKGLHPNDPLALFYKTFYELYQELQALKPTLIQERVAGDPWKLLIAVTLLNKTSGRLAIPLFWELLEKWPTPWALSQAKEQELAIFLQKLGTQNVRSKRLIQLSKGYLKDTPSIYDLRPSRSTSSSSKSPKKSQKKYPPTPISHLPGTGPYALDSFRIFCALHDNPDSTEWQTVMTSDKELIRYLKWRWASVEHKQWSSASGVGPPVTIPYLRRLILELKTS